MPEMFPEDLQRFVEGELASGHFRSTRELLMEGIRALQRERTEAMEGIQAGLNDIEAGRFQPLDEALAELRRDLGMPAHNGQAVFWYGLGNGQQGKDNYIGGKTAPSPRPKWLARFYEALQSLPDGTLQRCRNRQQWTGRSIVLFGRRQSTWRALFVIQDDEFAYCTCARAAGIRGSARSRHVRTGEDEWQRCNAPDDRLKRRE